jgi:hypothetical protein
MKKNLLLSGLMVLGLGAMAQTPRLSLYEEFTGETCPPCASTNPGLNALLALPANHAKCVALKWQVPIPSAPSNAWSLYQTNKAEIDWRYRSTAAGGYGYGINSAPSGKMDGQNVTVFGASSNHPANLTSGHITTAQSYTSAFSVTMARAWDATGSAVNVTVNITASAPFTAVGPLVFRTVMVERLIQFSVQPGTNGEKDFEDVAIKSFPTLQNGVAMASTWILGQTQTFTLNCPIPTYVRKKTEIDMVGFIQDDGNFKVAQAVRSGKQALTNDALAINAQVGVVCTSTFAPIATVKNEGLNAITAMSITSSLNGGAGNATTWTGNLAAGTTTTIALNTLNTPTANGSNNLTYTITALNAVDFNTTNNSAKVSFAVANSYQGAAVVEGFVLGAFPPVGFTNVNPDNGPTWARVTGVGGYGLSTQAAKYNFFTNLAVGDKDEFILPPMNLAGANTPTLNFDITYVQRTATSNDMLEVFVSTNCGANWTSVFSQSGALMTVLPPQASAYTPAADDWRTESVFLTGYNQSSVLVKFVTTSDGGNNLYLDNINLSQSAPVGITKNATTTLKASIYPNPASEIVNVRVITPIAGKGTIKVVNALGQLVFEKQTNLTSGTNVIELNSKELSNGIYSVMIESSGSTVVKTLSINK